ncbi:MAG: ABC transporter permease [Euryarchaeota archaeon]|nr:ABC transporter permease [Euryarchaeota archaeon]
MAISGQAIYVLWLREMKGMWRAKSRVVGTLGMPIFLLAFLGLGFGRASIPGMPEGVSYIEYLTPGIIGMSMLFSSVFAGISVLWDIPIFLLSGALFPIEALPSWLIPVCYINPLTYGVDGLRGSCSAWERQNFLYCSILS